MCFPRLSLAPGERIPVSYVHVSIKPDLSISIRQTTRCICVSDAKQTDVRMISTVPPRPVPARPC